MRALLVIDMQEQYIGEVRNKRRFPYHAQHLIDNVNRRIEEYERAGEQVLYIINDPFKQGPGLCPQLVSGLYIASDLIFSKNRASCFTSPELPAYLKEQGIDEIEVTGIDGNYCAGMSAMDSAKHGLKTFLNLACVEAGKSEKFIKTKQKLQKAGVILKNTAYDILLFDLDGTLTDPGEGITNAIAYALSQYGIEETDRTKLYPFIGPPLLDSFMQFYGFSMEQAREAVQYYREYYHDKGIFENLLYPGILELLQNLQDHGKKLILATSKPEQFAKRILEHFHIDQYFHFIAGATMDETRTRKDEVIAYALDSCALSVSGQILMIGDRMHDIQGAKKNGLQSMGVLFGYGNREELEQAGADWIVGTVEEIGGILL